MELHGPRITLREPTEKDVPLFASWTQDPEVIEEMHINPFTVEEEIKWFRETMDNPDELLFAIYIGDAPKPIGTCQIMQISKKDSEGVCLGIMIGDKGEWDKGYGTEAITLVKEYARDVTKAPRAWLTASAKHPRAIRCYEKCGFKKVERHNNPNRPRGSGEEFVMEVQF